MIILLRILHVDSVFTECLPKDYMLHAQRTIKTCLLLGRKAILESVLKSREITLLTKVHIVKAVVFPVVMYVWI